MTSLVQKEGSVGRFWKSVALGTEIFLNSMNKLELFVPLKKITRTTKCWFMFWCHFTKVNLLVHCANGQKQYLSLYLPLN